jgi:phage shock protein C
MVRKAVKKKPAGPEKKLDRQVGHFRDEVHTLGRRFERRMDEKGHEWDSWFRRTFGLAGPIISSIIGVVILVLLVWVISFVNLPLGSQFLANIRGFLLNNLGMFFLIFLFFSYSSYFSRDYPRGYRPFSPLVVALGLVIALWLAARAIIIANLSLGITFLAQATSFVLGNIILIFGFVVVLGYVIFSISLAFSGHGEAVKAAPMERVSPRSPPPGGVKRLYRSGRDKILGGVCGGIAEYLGVDPVLIRLLWIIGTLAWGAGIVAYIIAWIIIPRNPGHTWED